MILFSSFKCLANFKIQGCIFQRKVSRLASYCWQYCHRNQPLTFKVWPKSQEHKYAHWTLSLYSVPQMHEAFAACVSPAKKSPPGKWLHFCCNSAVGRSCIVRTRKEQHEHSGTGHMIILLSTISRSELLNHSKLRTIALSDLVISIGCLSNHVTKSIGSAWIKAWFFVLFSMSGSRGTESSSLWIFHYSGTWL